MKKLVTLLVLAIVATVSIYAQTGEKAVGVNLSYGTEISNLGIGVKGQYNVTDPIRLEASFDYFLKKNGMDMWDVNLNAHYLFNVAEKITVYPLVGLTLTSWGGDVETGTEGVKYNWSRDDWWYDDDYDFDDDKHDNNKKDDDGDPNARASKFGANVGAGVQYAITDRLNLNFEVKYQLISDFGQAVFGVGVAYKF